MKVKKNARLTCKTSQNVGSPTTYVASFVQKKGIFYSSSSANAYFAAKKIVESGLGTSTDFQASTL
jgi:hypothetical protein